MPSRPASSEPVRRVLFPTPQRGRDETPTSSVRRVRPKAELTPIEVDSTPSFRRLVDSSPVPLAVAAAAAAMRAAKSSPNGHPIITDMTRAAEEVIRNSEYNSIRPPQPSPRSLSSPRFSTFCAAQSASVSLPPIPSPGIRPGSYVNAVRENFGQRTAPSSSTAPPVNSAAHHPLNQYDMNRRKALLPGAQSISHIARRRVVTTLFHQPNAMPASSNKIEPKQVLPFGNHPTPRPRSKFLSLLHPASAIREDHATESPVQTSGRLEDAYGKIETAENTAESSEDRGKPRPQQLSKDTVGTTQEDKENIASRIQTRSLKRSKPEPHPMVPEDSKYRKPKKRRRMSEVLRLQKALESAAWTNSLAVERQTEVIEIPDSFPYRPRAELSVKTQSKTSRPDDVVHRAVQAEDPRQIAKVDKKPKPRIDVRGTRGPSKQKETRKTNLEQSTNKQGKPKTAEVKRKRSAVKNTKTERTTDGNEAASNGSHGTSVEKKRTKKDTEKKKSTDRLRKPDFCKERQAHDNIPSPVSTTSVAESQVPLKKRIAAEQRGLNSVSRPETIVASHSRTDARPDKSSRKTSNPKRLCPPT